MGIREVRDFVVVMYRFSYYILVFNVFFFGDSFCNSFLLFFCVVFVLVFKYSCVFFMFLAFILRFGIVGLFFRSVVDRIWVLVFV